MIAEAWGTDSGHSPHSPRHKYNLQREQNLNKNEKKKKPLWKTLKKETKNETKLLKQIH